MAAIAGGVLARRGRGCESQSTWMRVRHLISGISVPGVFTKGGEFKRHVASTTGDSIRLARLMALQGLCSRREAETYIRNGAVLVNGERVTGDWCLVPRSAVVQLDARAQQHQRSKVTIALNKPLGYVSSQPEGTLVPAVKLLSWMNEYGDSNSRHHSNVEPLRLPKMAVCGRLDVNSTGLLIFTQDGTFARRVLDHKYNIEKEYLVRVDARLDSTYTHLQEQLARLRAGVTRRGIEYQAKAVDVVNENQLRFVLVGGKHHHIRHMCESVGLQVMALKRVRIGNISLGTLPVGKWTYINADKLSKRGNGSSY